MMGILQILVPVLYSVVIIAATWVVARLAGMILKRIMGQGTQLSDRVQRLAYMLVWLVGLILAIEQLGVNPDILIVLVGLFGVAAIVAMRKSLENLGAKYFTQGYIPFKVGDSITIQGNSGRIIEMNAMNVILLTREQHIISVPNSIFMREVVVNTTQQAWKSVTLPVVVRKDIDLPSFESAVLRSLGKLRPHFDDRFPPILTVTSRTSQSTQLTLDVMISDPEERDTIVSEISKRIAEIISAMQKEKKAAPDKQEAQAQ